MNQDTGTYPSLLNVMVGSGSELNLIRIFFSYWTAMQKSFFWSLEPAYSLIQLQQIKNNYHPTYWINVSRYQLTCTWRCNPLAASTVPCLYCSSPPPRRWGERDKIFIFLGLHNGAIRARLGGDEVERGNGSSGQKQRGGYTSSSQHRIRSEKYKPKFSLVWSFWIAFEQKSEKAVLFLTYCLY